MRQRALDAVDTFLHWSLDGYINGQRPCWGLIQLWQWRFCQVCEARRT